MSSNEHFGEYEARRMTQKEVQEEFLHHLWAMVKEWENPGNRSIAGVPKEVSESAAYKLQGLAFSFLSMLDGCSGELPAFEVYSCPHSEAKAYCQENGENWWPQLEDEVTVHGEDMLHELWHDFGRRHGYLKDGIPARKSK